MTTWVRSRSFDWRRRSASNRARRDNAGRPRRTNYLGGAGRRPLRRAPDHPFRRFGPADPDRRRGSRLRPGRAARGEAQRTALRASPSSRSAPPARPSPTPAWRSSRSADRVAVAVGCAVAGTPESEEAVDALLESGPRAVSPFYVASTIPNMAACEVAIDLKAHGPVTATALACATGTYALLEARRLILRRRGRRGDRRRHRRGDQRRDVRRALEHGPALGAQRRPGRGQPALRQRPRRLRLRRGRGGDGGRVRRARRRPRRPLLRQRRRRRPHRRRLPHERAGAERRLRLAGDRAGARARRDSARGARLRVRPRDRHPRQRHLREQSDPGRRSARPPTACRSARRSRWSGT